MRFERSVSRKGDARQGSLEEEKKGENIQIQKKKKKKKKMKRILVTFDVDGTLIKSSGLLHRQAFSHAFLQVFNVKGSIDAIKYHGQTDPAIIVKTLVHYGIPYELANGKLPILKSSMVDYVKSHAEDIGKGLEVLPGVEALLQCLSSRENVIIGLVTGNLEEIAWMKMEALGIKKYFTVPNFGGFGSDHMERGHLVRIAAERAENLFPGNLDLRVHVGDALSDIQAAEFGGALPVGVCTGIFTAEELEGASNGGNALILPDLCDTRSFMAMLGIDD